VANQRGEEPAKTSAKVMEREPPRRIKINFERKEANFLPGVKSIIEGVSCFSRKRFQG
jgi:hypothetical protein